MKIVSGALDSVRKDETKYLYTMNDKTLSGSKFMWLYYQENLPQIHQARFNI